MFTPWIKRKSLKKAARGKNLVVDGERPSLIMLLSLSGFLVLVGVLVVQRGMAASWWNAQDQPAPTVMMTPGASPTLSPTPTPMPSSR